MSKRQATRVSCLSRFSRVSPACPGSLHFTSHTTRLQSSFPVARRRLGEATRRDDHPILKTHNCTNQEKMEQTGRPTVEQSRPPAVTARGGISSAVSRTHICCVSSCNGSICGLFETSFQESAAQLASNSRKNIRFLQRVETLPAQNYCATPKDTASVLQFGCQTAGSRTTGICGPSCRTNGCNDQGIE